MSITKKMVGLISIALVIAIVCASALCYYCASKSYGAIKNTVYAYYQKGYVATGEYGTVKGKKLNGCWVRLKETPHNTQVYGSEYKST